MISIHALREEGDAKKPANLSRIRNFYPRPPRGGRRPAHSSNTLPVQFLSTPSARRATRQRGPCRHHRSISIHALREEGDVQCVINCVQLFKFLSTPSARRATVTQAIRGQWPTYFYPRPPRGGRPDISCFLRSLLLFLSTPSARRATLLFWLSHPVKSGFLSTPSARRATLSLLTLVCRFRFLSTPSARRATCCKQTLREPAEISIHALREEGDSTSMLFAAAFFLFLSTPSARRATSHGHLLF